MTRLLAQRDQVKARWEGVLRLEKMTSPLANPDALVHLVDHTLDEFFAALPVEWARQTSGAAGTDQACSTAPAPCPCGRNPLIAYFSAGRQAVLEALVLGQVAMPDSAKAERDAAMQCVDRCYRDIERRELGLFCDLCQWREPAAGPVATGV